MVLSGWRKWANGYGMGGLALLVGCFGSQGTGLLQWAKVMNWRVGQASGYPSGVACGSCLGPGSYRAWAVQLQSCDRWDVEMRELPRQWSLGIQLFFCGIQGHRQGRI